MLLLAGFLLSQTVQTVLLNGASPSAPACDFSTTKTIDVPTGGRIECAAITVPSSVTITFRRNAMNDPVYLLSRGAVSIAGTITVSGAQATGPSGGIAGPGGYDGGAASQDGSNGGPGHGPGGGRDVSASPYSFTTRSASFGAVGGYGGETSSGATYGAVGNFPLIGGSGGAGNRSQRGGGGGGGAVLVGSETSITVTGSILALGGNYSDPDAGGGGYSGGGSGGAIRLVAPAVTVTSSGTLDARGNYSNYAGAGRIRIDGITKSVAGNSYPGASFGSNLIVALDAPPRVDLVSVAGIATNGQPFVQMLPVGAPASQPVVIHAQDFPSCVDIDIYVVPDAGTPAKTSLTCQPNGTINTNVNIPSNTRVTVEVFGTPATQAQ